MKQEKGKWKGKHWNSPRIFFIIQNYTLFFKSIQFVSYTKEYFLLALLLSEQTDLEWKIEKTSCLRVFIEQRNSLRLFETLKRF